MWIRSLSWGKADLSWSRVMERLLLAAEQQQHSVSFLSTNGYQGMQYWDEARSALMQKESQKYADESGFDIDITYTIPMNFSQRFLSNSRVKIGRFDYESTVLPKSLAKYLNVPDYVVGSSDFVLDVFRNAGAKEEKLRKIQSGVDLNVFNEKSPPYKRQSLGLDDDTYVFLCVAEPHYRKQIDVLIDTFCKTFTSKDNVALVIKTKLFKSEDKRLGFEQDIGMLLGSVLSKYKDPPQIKLIGGFLPNMARLYCSANAFVSMTAGEGWGMPFLEAMACGNLVIAPQYGGQLDFLSEKNSLLCPVQMRPARGHLEQYGAASAADLPNGLVGPPNPKIYSELMRLAYEQHSNTLTPLLAHMSETVKKFTWQNAANQMLEIANETLSSGKIDRVAFTDTEQSNTTPCVE